MASEVCKYVSYLAGFLLRYSDTLPCARFKISWHNSQLYGWQLKWSSYYETIGQLGFRVTYTKISRCLRGLTITTQNHFNNYYLVEQLNIHAASIERLDVMRKIRTYIFFGAHNYHSNSITIVRCDWLNPMAFKKTYIFY